MKLKNKDIIAVRIKRAMKNKNISQVELAKLIGTSQAAISQMLNSHKGYALTEKMLRKICKVLDLNYEDVITVKPNIEGTTLDSKDYERGIIYMTIDKYGVDVSHVVVSAGLVYIADKYSNFMFSCGDRVLSREELEKHIEEDKQYVKEHELYEGAVEELFDEYYELSYRGKKKKLSVVEYDNMMDSLNTMMLNSLDFIFTL